ncbi:hypothetical protein FOQG_18775 [Fusarium oxysporum f. sp. raphani 54005]|uniref:Uncharacterized protein n=2 Tax=Fusarium oxysporum TaxID=5507 RepID=X0BDB3_FUSOX|nr:hypothetical protein FOVG_17915 [Fusarium oxysporum f. sp. pisi HDV247]EXK76484.1 hypothetical protein FOQG_18775 [Fusarium oxysporum f. sp. raphani 54005]
MTRPAGSFTQLFLSHTSVGRSPMANTIRPLEIWSVTWSLFLALASSTPPALAAWPTSSLN